jgi:UDP-glucose 4-epimerase
MPNQEPRNVLILGGAGFIGSRLAYRFVDWGDKVTIIDGLLEGTGGRKLNLAPILERVIFWDRTLEEVDHLGGLLCESDIIIDCMAWTAHRLALEDPLYDLRLNAASHLFLLKALRAFKGKKVIYLGSISQYGREPGLLDESSRQSPVDIQGIHKMTAEHYFRLFSSLDQHKVICLRLSHCFGENQPLVGDDIGLVGGFIRDLLQGKEVKVYGNPEERYRHFLYVQDLAEYIIRFSRLEFAAFDTYNIIGQTITIGRLLTILIELIGRGSIQHLLMPAHLHTIAADQLFFNHEKTKLVLGDCPSTDIRTALQRTVRYFQEHLHDIPL